MDILKKIEFKFTDDNSVGLYDKCIQDIFHSKTGALLESYEKFVKPILNLDIIINQKDIRVLDICYGIGYNSKTFLNTLKNKVIKIDALEYNPEFVFLSPFIKDGINSNELNNFLLNQIVKNESDFSFLKSLILELDNLSINQFFTPCLSNFNVFLYNLSYKSYQSNKNNRFLHNIYYNYVSTGNTNNHVETNYINSTIKFHYGDARKSLLNINNKYDVIFLDAFSSQKDPTLWTIDFLNQIKERMSYDSVLVTYSKSTPFRSALIELGFNVGKTFINQIDMGTIASLNSSNIINPLSDYDFNLIKTRSGITYKDEFFDLTPQDILKNRESEAKLSDRISHTQFIKNNKTYKYY